MISQNTYYMHIQLLTYLQVLFDFGWASKYRDERAYFGTTNMNDTTSFHFPGLSLEAGELLAERGIWGEW